LHKVAVTNDGPAMLLRDLYITDTSEQGMASQHWPVFSLRYTVMLRVYVKFDKNILNAKFRSQFYLYIAVSCIIVNIS
jgi:hypothetical protein